ncbi:MAG: sigma-70 family RNA polymerase sigma factor [Bacteroidales bacterium]|nr:sigma-70 family RNA polymerase sigma factor [Bacteroidales bacterium]
MKDEELILELKNPKTKDLAFDKVVNLYKERLYFYIRRMVIDHENTNDLLQDTFFKAYMNLDRFRFDSQIFTWLYKIATTTTINFLNKKKKQNTFSFSDKDFENLADKVESDPLFDGDELQKQLQKAILKLPRKQRLVFNMRYFEEIKYEEMSKILGTSVGALKASYHIAVEKIEKNINEI